MLRAEITALLLPLTEMGPSLHHALQDAERFGVRNFDAYLVEVEVDVGSARMQDFNVVGLPDNAVKESRERIKSALRNCGFEFPHGQGVTINLAPAVVPQGRLGIRSAHGAGIGRLPGIVLRQTIGQDDASGRAVAGRQRALGALSAALAAREFGLKSLAAPEANAKEAAVVEGVDV